MIDEDRNRTEFECARLLTAFYAALDSRRYEDVVATFTEDGVWFRMGESLNGAGAIKAALDARFSDVLVVHGLSNIHFLEVGETQARSQALVIVYAGKPGSDGAPGKGGLVGVTRTETDYVRTDRGWRIAHHDGRPVMTPT